MAAILYKWLVSLLLSAPGLSHPIYMSVTSIEHNSKDHSLEITSKLFADDFEKVLRKQNKTKIDLLSEKSRNEMNQLVFDYLKRHLKITVNEAPKELRWVGYEQQQDAIVCYLEVLNIPDVKKIQVFDDILYEYQKEQISILHLTVDGKRTSTRLINPNAEFTAFF